MKTKAFTLVEVMIVIVIIGLLAAMTIPAFQKVKASGIEKRLNNHEYVSREDYKWYQEHKSTSSSVSTQQTDIAQSVNEAEERAKLQAELAKAQASVEIQKAKIELAKAQREAEVELALAKKQAAEFLRTINKSDEGPFQTVDDNGRKFFLIPKKSYKVIDADKDTYIIIPSN